MLQVRRASCFPNYDDDVRTHSQLRDQDTFILAGVQQSNSVSATSVENESMEKSNIRGWLPCECPRGPAGRGRVNSGREIPRAVDLENTMTTIRSVNAGQSRNFGFVRLISCHTTENSRFLVQFRRLEGSETKLELRSTSQIHESTPGNIRSLR